MNLQDSLKIASHLARIQYAINDVRDKKPIQDKDWILNLFKINSSDEDAGKIIYFLLEENEHLASFLLNFSYKIQDNQELNQDDWDMIYGALLAYRSHLLSLNYKSRCG